MSKDSESIDQIFQLHEEESKSASRKLNIVRTGTEKNETSRKIGEIHIPTGKLTPEERAWASEQAAEEQEVPNLHYHPIQQRDDNQTGCLGGLMYTVFILCISIIFACLAWMAASDMLALNKDSFTATVVLPESVFRSEVVDVTDDDGNVTGQKTVKRADISYLSNTLKQAGLIEYRWLFESYCRIAKADTKVKPGEYELKSTYDYRALVQNMRPNGGGAVTVNVTLIEGMTMHEMFVMLERRGVSSYEDLMAAAKDYSFNYGFIAEPGEEGAGRLEGYLFPETYNFYANMQASSAINKFLDEFNSHLTEEMLQRLEEEGRSLRDVVTVASMIEKEAADDEERADIASVIYNRLNAGMVLGSTRPSSISIRNTRGHRRPRCLQRTAPTTPAEVPASRRHRSAIPAFPAWRLLCGLRRPIICTMRWIRRPDGIASLTIRKSSTPLSPHRITLNPQRDNPARTDSNL